jgi:hypothetical protein
LEKLKQKKAEVEARSMDALLQWLMRDEVAQEAPVPAEKPDEVDAPGPEKGRKFFVAEPLYSMETLRERRGMLEYVTSFEKGDQALDQTIL